MIRARRKDLLGGAALFAVGAAVLYGAFSLGLGSGRNMGPGYFPMLAAGFMMTSALLTIVTSFLGENHLPKVRWKPLVWISLSIIAFVGLMPFVGLLPTVFVTVLVASIADESFHLGKASLLAVAACLASWLVFIYGLSLPIRPYIIPGL